MRVDAGPRSPVVPETATRRRGRLPPVAAAAALDVLVLVVMLAAAAFRKGDGAAFPSPGVLTLAIAAWLPLLARNRWPVPALAVVTAVECIHLAALPFPGSHPVAAVAMGAYQPVPIATMVAAWTVASRRRWPAGWIAGGSAAGALLAVSVIAQPSFLTATDMVMFDAVILATAAGVLVSIRREKSARLARERQEETERKVAAERLRIARDLHDVVAHHLTLVNAQASVAEYLMRGDARAAAALSGISVHSRQALDELRATVGLLRSPGDGPGAVSGGGHSTPGIDRLGELAESFRSAGTHVSVTVTGAPAELAPGGDLAVYRIAQESLTNAAKHAPGAKAAVALHWQAGQLDLAVTNQPPSARPPGYRGPGTGHGIIGMRERARSCGGTLTARPAPDGGFAVLAMIPVKGRPS